jgi:hypothetical protein
MYRVQNDRYASLHICSFFFFEKKSFNKVCDQNNIERKRNWEFIKLNIYKYVHHHKYHRLDNHVFYTTHHRYICHLEIEKQNYIFYYSISWLLPIFSLVIGSCSHRHLWPSPHTPYAKPRSLHHCWQPHLDPSVNSREDNSQVF